MVCQLNTKPFLAATTSSNHKSKNSGRFLRFLMYVFLYDLWFKYGFSSRKYGPLIRTVHSLLLRNHKPYVKHTKKTYEEILKINHNLKMYG